MQSHPQRHWIHAKKWERDRQANSRTHFRWSMHLNIRTSSIWFSFFSLLPQRRIWWGDRCNEHGNIEWMGIKEVHVYILSIQCTGMKKKKKTIERKSNKEKNMDINTSPVSFFSQSGILVTGSNHIYRQDNHIPSGEDWWFEVQFTNEWAKKEGTVPATI